MKVVEYALGQPTIGGLCSVFGQGKNGTSATTVGALQRLGVSPDGSLVVFEVTTDFSINAQVVPEDQQGIFAARADGTGLVQHTQMQGVIRHADGSIDVELPGPLRAASFIR